MITLEYGFDKELLVSANSLDFKFNLGYPDVLVNIKIQDCLPKDSCIVQGAKTFKDDSYQGLPYKYYEAKSFLGVNRIRPGELETNKDGQYQNYYDLPMRFFEPNEKMPHNVLGLSPNSVIWNYWENLYHFPGKHINMTFTYNPDDEFILFDSSIDMDEEVLYKVNKKSNLYLFEGITEYDFRSKKQEGRDKICISNDKGLALKLAPSFYGDLMGKLCTNPAQCTKVSDLSQNPVKFEVKMMDHMRQDAQFILKFENESLYSEVNGELIWRIAPINELET